MSQSDLAREIISTYRKNGWQLRRALVRPEHLTEISSLEPNLTESLRIDEASFDALWFSRPSHRNREAWELRLLAETQYALFEAFEKDEPEEAREEMRREMEARLRDYVSDT